MRNKSDTVSPASDRPSTIQGNHPLFSISWIYWLPLVVCLLVMIPRLLDAHFGLLDDAFNITAARQILNGDLSMSYDITRGRYRPAYWLLFAVLYGTAGFNSFWFFVANTVMFCITTVGLVALVKKFSAPLPAGLSGLFFALSVPGIENYYTFSKGEAAQLTCLILAMLVAHTQWRTDNKATRIARVILGAGLVYLAVITKETTLVMIPIALVWVGISWWINHHLKQDSHFNGWAIFLAAVMTGAIVYLIARSLALGSAVEVNSQRFTITLTSLIDSAVRWTGWLLRDFLFLIPLALLLAWIVIRRRNYRPLGSILFTLTWMGGWICTYLPWSSANDYFLLPFSLGAAVFSGISLALAFQADGLPNLPWSGRGILLTLFGLLFSGSLLIGFSSARTQLTIDRANSEMIDLLITELPQNSLLLVNIQDPNEYFDEIRIYLNEVLGRPDIRVQAVQAGQASSLTASEASYYLLNPLVQNQMLMTVRMGVIESSVSAWDATLPEYLGEGNQPIGQVRSGFQNFTFDFPRLFCGVIKERGFCASSQPLLDQRVFQYGWDLYRVER